MQLCKIKASEKYHKVLVAK